MNDTLLKQIYDVFTKSSGISTDTRNINDGNLFFALKGPKFNANKFASQALDQGAIACVIDDQEFARDDRYLVVEDTLVALQELAKHYRDQLDIPILGITGSNGKTTTKELLHAALSKKYNTFSTKGNLNNHIGVPLSILSIKPEHEIAIIEMGANRVGDISELCAIAKPNHGLITNIGSAHKGTFGGIDGIIRGKSELYHSLIKSNGVVFINSNEEVLKNMGKRFEKVYYYPNTGDFCEVTFKGADPFVEFESENSQHYKSNLIGAYNFGNIATALCVAKYFNVNENDAGEAITAYIPENNRSQIVEKSHLTVIMDAYNANPTSMSVAIKNLMSMDAEKRMVILGDMLELGEYSKEEHSKLGEKLSEISIDEILLVGPEMSAAHQACSKAHYFATKSELLEYLSRNKFTNYIVLIKGSRGIGLEDALPLL